MLYLLHFERPLSKAQHYLGWCREDRLSERLTEHARQKGAALTRAVVQRGIPIYLARVFPELGNVQEQKIKRASHFKNLCPLCCPLFEKLKGDHVLVNPPRPATPPQRAIWDWRPRLDQQRT